MLAMKAGSGLLLSWISSQLSCEFLLFRESRISTKVDTVFWKRYVVFEPVAESLVFPKGQFSFCQPCCDIGPVSALQGGTCVQKSSFSNMPYKMISLNFAFLTTSVSVSTLLYSCSWYFMSASDLVSTSVTSLRVPAHVLSQLCWPV